MQISKKSTVVVATILGVGAVTGVGAATFASEIPLFQGTSGAVESVENSILEPAEDLGPVAELAPLESGVGPALGPEEASSVSAPSEASPASAPSGASPPSSD